MTISTLCCLVRLQSFARALNLSKNLPIGLSILPVNHGASLDHVDGMGVVAGIVVDVGCVGVEWIVVVGYGMRDG
jgi:hypothetical protein